MPNLEIHGCLIQLRVKPKKDSTHANIKLKRIVSPEWVQLWYQILENKFDQTLWLSLSSDMKQLLGKVSRECGIQNNGLNIAIAEAFRRSHDRLKLLEGNVKSGNMNPTLVEEYISIIHELKDSGQMNNHSAGRLVAQIKRTYKELLTSTE